MKKLMIAAAAVAMIGVAEATTTNLIYNYSASLKTTTGKKGKDIKTSYSVKLGMDANGKFWYEKFVDGANGSWGDPANPAATPKAWTMAKNGVYGVFTVDGKAYSNVTFTAGANGWEIGKLNKNFNGMTELEKLIFAVAFGFDGEDTDYDKKSDGTWCQTFSFVYTSPAQCYRVASSKSIKGYVKIAAPCCVAGVGDTWQLLEEVDDNAGTTVNVKMNNRFGAQTANKATKVEWMGDFGTFGVANGFCLAGQGTWARLTFKEGNGTAAIDGISAISGNIVGALPGSVCTYCCEPNTAAAFFKCANGTSNDGYGDILVPTLSTDKLSTAEPTAAFGTFTMKYNKKESEAK